jgi:hypothetical protein
VDLPEDFECPRCGLHTGSAWPDVEPYSTKDAIFTAQLWRAGKMVGGDADAVRDALLAEVERLSGPAGEGTP